MHRSLLILCLALLAGFPAAAQAGRNPNATVLLHTSAFNSALANCPAVNALVTSCESAIPTADPAWTDVIVSVFIFQSAASDPLPGNPGAPGLHLLGIDFGIDYDPSAMALSWTLCGALDLPTDGENPPGDPSPRWPIPGSGNSVVWTSVQRGELALVGYFRVSAYGPGRLSIVGHPLYHVVQVLDDDYVFDTVLQPGAAGFGGLMGSNACSPLKIRDSSWGRIKSQFGL